MKFVTAVLSLFFIPTHAYAAEVAFRLIDEVYASSPVESESSEPDVGNLTGRQAREYREKLMEQYAEENSSSESDDSMLDETMASDTVPVQEEGSREMHEEESSSSVEPQEPYFSSSSSEVSAPAHTYVPPTPQEQEEQDRLTLEQLEEYRDEAYANKEEQLTQLNNGFSITSTSSLGSPLSTAQRAAILRRGVRTTAQLKLFARALAESDENLRKIEVSSDGIHVSYRSKAWIFGFIPVHYLLSLNVDGTTVSADQPWWHVISRDGVQGDVANLETILSSQQEDASTGDELHDTLTGIQSVLKDVAQFLRGDDGEQPA